MQDVGFTVPIQRVQALVELARRHGVDVEKLLADAGIAPLLLDEGRSRVTLAQASDLIERAARITDDELFGLGLAPVPRGTLRLVCFGLLNAPDMRACVQRFESFNRSLPGFPPVTLSESGDEARLSFDISDVSQPVGVVIDTMLVFTHRLISWLIRKRVQLRRVEVPYSDSGIDDYDVIFGAPVVFGAQAPALVFDADILSEPLVRDEDELVALLRDSPGDLLRRRDYSISLSSQVRRIVERGLTGEWPTVEDIAAELTMSPQTLRRKLREENTSTREIRENILRDAAIASLVRGDETVAALSRRLGFSEPSAFSRAFSRWTGSPPGSYQH